MMLTAHAFTRAWSAGVASVIVVSPYALSICSSVVSQCSRNGQLTRGDQALELRQAHYQGDRVQGFRHGGRYSVLACFGCSLIGRGLGGKRDVGNDGIN